LPFWLSCGFTKRTSPFSFLYLFVTCMSRVISVFPCPLQCRQKDHSHALHKSLIHKMLWRRSLEGAPEKFYLRPQNFRPILAQRLKGHSSNRVLEQQNVVSSNSPCFPTKKTAPTRVFVTCTCMRPSMAPLKRQRNMRFWTLVGVKSLTRGRHRCTIKKAMYLSAGKQCSGLAWRQNVCSGL
jgi:hypothetical protein